MRKFIIYLLVLFILVGCADSSPKSINVGDECNRNGAGICRIIDMEAKVVCYIYNAKAISCVPQNQTVLP